MKPISYLLLRNENQRSEVEECKRRGCYDEVEYRIMNEKWPLY